MRGSQNHELRGRGEGKGKGKGKGQQSRNKNKQDVGECKSKITERECNL